MTRLSGMHASAMPADWRERARWALQWTTAVSWPTGAARARVLDLSETGLLLATEIPLAVGDEFEIDLPEVGPCSAAVVWRHEHYAGCEFRSAIASEAVGTALHQAAA